MEGERLAGILTRGAVQRVVEVRRLLAPEASPSHET
jgi:hypothetical protein